jgi:hypothetical protein
LVEQQSTNVVIGKYNGLDVTLKKGKFGNYITFGDEKKSLNGITKDMSELTMEDIIPIIEKKITLNANMIRIINSDISIRSGKFGHYIFYKTEKMTKPKFIKLKAFKGDYNTCPEEEIEKYVNSNK